MTDENEKLILEELRKISAFYAKTYKLSIGLLVAFGFVLIASIPIRYALAHKPKPLETVTDSWYAARTIGDRGDPQKAIEMVKRLIAKTPDYYYGYGLLGSYYLELGDLDGAERNYAKAYELYPSEGHQKELEAVRRAIENRKNSQVPVVLPK